MFDIEFAPEAYEDLESFRKYEQVRICEEVEKQLRHQPDVETRNRKRLQAGHVAGWEVRIGDTRVFYDVDQEASLVKVARVGYKKRSRLLFRGEEFSP